MQLFPRVRIILYAVVAFFSVCSLQAKVGGNIRNKAELEFPAKDLKMTAEIHTKKGDGSYLIVVFRKVDKVITKEKFKIYDWVEGLEADVQYARSIKSIERDKDKIIIIVSGGKTYKVDIP